jgi:hypothetical protein
MATVQGAEYSGPTIIDLSNVKSVLVDLAAGAMKGMRTEQEGLPLVLKELGESTAKQRQVANIPEHVYQRIIDATVTVKDLRDHVATLTKALEVCKETLVKKVNDREDDLGMVAKAAKETAEKMRAPAIAAPFEQTIKYNGQIAEKAVKTRRKNAEAKAAAEQQGEPGEEPGEEPGDE